MAPVIAGFWERAEFPFKLVPSFAALGLAGGNIRGYGCPVSRGGAGDGPHGPGLGLSWTTWLPAGLALRAMGEVGGRTATMEFVSYHLPLNLLYPAITGHERDGQRHGGD